MLTDIEIAQACTPEPIEKIAEKAGIDDKYLECYGKYKAKVDYNLLRNEQHEPGKLDPGHRDQPRRRRARARPPRRSVWRTRLAKHRQERSWSRCASRRSGPVFGIKGGAAGGGYAQVVPMEDINLHFTGRFPRHRRGEQPARRHARQPHPPGQRAGHRPAPHHLAARCVDMNDRQLRYIVDGLGGTGQRRAARGRLRHHRRLARSWRVSASPLTSPTSRSGLRRIVVGYTYDDKPVTAGDLHAQGAMAALLQ